MRKSGKNNPPELVVYDGFEPCPYLKNETARLPMRYPLRAFTPEEFNERLAAGDRRQGNMIYRTACPACQACQPVRVDATRFVPNRAQRRVQRKAAGQLRIEMGTPQVDARRVQLYNRHKQGRRLTHGEGPISADGYAAFLVESCCETFELRYYHGDELIGVAVTDRSSQALSAVYCFFDPAYEHLSPGTYSILKQIELCRAWDLPYLYLGFYLDAPSRMSYKGNFRPQQRLRGGQWIDFEHDSDR